MEKGISNYYEFTTVRRFWSLRGAYKDLTISG
jgi:hypothetical protein